MTWTVLRVKPAMDAYVAHRLKDTLALTVRFLTHWGTEKLGKRERAILKPLFPGYLFVQLDPEHDQWIDICNQYGVIAFITANGGPGKPVTLSQKAEGLLFAHSDSRGVVDLEKRLRSPFQPDASVRVKNGPFEGHTGPIISRDTKKNVRVLLSVLGGQEIEFAERDLEVLH